MLVERIKAIFILVGNPADARPYQNFSDIMSLAFQEGGSG